MKTIQDVINNIQEGLKSLNSPMGNFNRYSNIYVLLRSFANIINDQDRQLEDLRSSLYINTATGRDLDLKAEDVGLYRTNGFRGRGYVLLSSTINKNLPPGTIFINPSTKQQFQLVNAVQVGSNEITALIESVIPGFVSISSGTSLYSTFHPDVNAVIGRYREFSNNQPSVSFYDGRNVESDDEFRNRIINYISNLEVNNVDSLRAAILGVEGVSQVYIVNNSPVIGYITVYVNTKNERVISQVEEVIRSRKKEGTAFNVLSLSGYPIDINAFVTVQQLADIDNVENLIRQSVSNYLNQLGLGAVINPQSLSSVIQNVSGVYDIRLNNPSNSITIPSNSIPVLRNIGITTTRI